MSSEVYIGFLLCCHRSLTEQVFLAEHSKSFVFSFLTLTLDLPGTGLIIRPIDSVHMNFSSISLGPIRGHIDGSNFAVHGNFKKLIVPSSSLELVSHTGDSEGTMFGVQREDVIQGFGHVLMVVFYNLSLVFLAFGKRTKFLRAIEA